MAHAIRFHEAGGPEVLRWEEVAVGNPGPGQARLRHVAVGLNFADTYFRAGSIQYRCRTASASKPPASSKRSATA